MDWGIAIYTGFAGLSNQAKHILGYDLWGGGYGLAPTLVVYLVFHTTSQNIPQVDCGRGYTLDCYTRYVLIYTLCRWQQQQQQQ